MYIYIYIYIIYIERETEVEQCNMPRKFLPVKAQID